MSNPLKVTVVLDRERSLTWGPRARLRIDSLPRQPARRGMYMIAATLWAMLDEADGFDLPEDLGEYLQTPEQVKAVGQAILAAQKLATDTPKNAPGSMQKPAPASS